MRNPAEVMQDALRLDVRDRAALAQELLASIRLEAEPIRYTMRAAVITSCHQRPHPLFGDSPRT
jgi:hypothetical protein